MMGISVCSPQSDHAAEWLLCLGVDQLKCQCTARTWLGFTAQVMIAANRQTKDQEQESAQWFGHSIDERFSATLDTRITLGGERFRGQAGHSGRGFG